MVYSGANCCKPKNNLEKISTRLDDPNALQVQVYIIGEVHAFQDNRDKLIKLADEGKINLFSEQEFFSSKKHVKNLMFVPVQNLSKKNLI